MRLISDLFAWLVVRLILLASLIVGLLICICGCCVLVGLRCFEVFAV